MRTIFTCFKPDCKKVLLKDASLPDGTMFKLKCYHCGALHEFKVIRGQISVSTLSGSSNNYPIVIKYKY